MFKFSKQRKHYLIDPFPTDKIITLDFGDADGHRDRMTEKTFVETTSIRLLKSGRHSIVAGPIGAGKSTIYKLIRKNSEFFKEYIANRTVVPIEEAVSFRALDQLIRDYFPDIEDKVVYQTIWYFHIVVRISEEISQYEGFPTNDDESAINNFLKETGAIGQCVGIIDRLKGMAEGLSAKVEAKILNTPVSLEVSTKKKKRRGEIKRINLNKVLKHCSDALQRRKKPGALVIIDRIDKFVAGEEYTAQKKYIEALLEIEDDLASIDNIQFNIFIRSDLFSRLDFSSLGYDKVNDRTLRLVWSDDEIIQFVASRILNSLEQSEIAAFPDILRSTDLSKYRLDGIWRLRFHPLIPTFIRSKLTEWRDIVRESRTSLITAFSNSIITKVFPRKIRHCNIKSQPDDLATDRFLQTHFRDGRGITTPRYLLIFLKETQIKVASYYDDNPDLYASVVQIGKDFEWKLFPQKCIYSAYISAKSIYIKNVCNIDDKWTRWIVHLLSIKAEKTIFNFKWMKNNLSSSVDDEIIAFMAFLESVGFLKIKIHDPDFRKRVFEFPILYLPHPSPNPILGGLQE